MPAAIACEGYDVGLDEATVSDVSRFMAANDFAAGWARTTEGAKHLFSTGDQSWRSGDVDAAGWHVLKAQAQEWKVALDSSLQLEKCEEYSLEETPILVGCNWFSPEGNQAFGVSLLKERQNNTGQKSNPWLVRGANATVCRAVSE